MQYTVLHLMAFVAAAIGLTLGARWGVPYCVEPLLADPSALHAFLFQRSPIQWWTLGLFFFALSAMMHRAVYYGRVQLGLRHFATEQTSHEMLPAPLVRDRFATVQACKKHAGAGAAASYNQELASRDEDVLERIYWLLGNMPPLMLALGFLGTVWGISQSMARSFGQLGAVDVAKIKQLLVVFGEALSTALDTTILAIICSLIVTVLLTLVRWLETNGLHTLHSRISDTLSLTTALHTREAELLSRFQPNWASMAEPFLREVATPLIQHAQAALQDLVSQTVAAFETKLGDAVQQHLALIQTHEREVADKLAETLEAQVEKVLQDIHAQAAQSRAALIEELGHIGQQLAQRPEIAIRYPEQNGALPYTTSQEKH